MIALVIVYLVMAVLFESFLYPWVVMLSVPVAAAGGLGGLALLNTYVNQPLDMLTMLGFVILVGIVVNNAILLVHQTLHHIRVDGSDVNGAIETATRNRIRPIFMSTLTSVFGMLPLVMFPGAGSELYRGLGSVVLGGLSLSGRAHHGDRSADDVDHGRRDRTPPPAQSERGGAAARRMTDRRSLLAGTVQLADVLSRKIQPPPSNRSPL